MWLHVCANIPPKRSFVIREHRHTREQNHIFFKLKGPTVSHAFRPPGEVCQAATASRPRPTCRIISFGGSEAEISCPWRPDVSPPPPKIISLFFCRCDAICEFPVSFRFVFVCFSALPPNLFDASPSGSLFWFKDSVTQLAAHSTTSSLGEFDIGAFRGPTRLTPATFMPSGSRGTGR